MPPRVREAKRYLRDHGFTIERSGKGDHWEKLKKRLGMK
jgi:hypothetical protein